MLPPPYSPGPLGLLKLTATRSPSLNGCSAQANTPSALDARLLRELDETLDTHNSYRVFATTRGGDRTLDPSCQPQL